MSVGSGGSTTSSTVVTTTSTSLTYTSQTVVTSTIITTTNVPVTTSSTLSVIASGPNGVLNVPVYLDGQSIGTTPVSSYSLTYGQHSVVCGTMTGLQAPAAFSIFENGANPIQIGCTYTAASGASGSSTLIITQESCSPLYANSCSPVAGGTVYLSDGQQGTPDSSGQVSFKVSPNTPYTVTSTGTSYGYNYLKVTSGAAGSTTTATFKFTATRLSILPFPSIGGLTADQSALLFSLVFFAMSGAMFVAYAKQQDEA